MKRVADETGIKLLRWSFSEIQAGKSVADRIAGQIKRYVHNYVDSGHDVTTHREFLMAINEQGMENLRGISAYEFSVTSNEEPTTSKESYKPRRAELPGITSYFEFQYEENGLRIFKQAGIGMGKLLAWPSSDKIRRLYQYKVIKDAGWTVPVDEIFWPTIAGEKSSLESGSRMQFWTFYERKNQNQPIRPAQTDVENEEKGWECPDESCDASFSTFADLESHFISQRHDRSLKKITLLDAVKTYKEALEEIDRSRMLPAVQDALEQHTTLIEPNEEDLPEGFAIHKRKPRVRFTDDQKNLLDEKFMDGINTGNKWDGQKLSSYMHNVRNRDGTKKFKAHEILSPIQIDRYFSVKSRKNKLFGSQQTSKLH